jgi:hypothetical protein
LQNVREQRNVGTHQRIHYSHHLEAMLKEMTTFCDLLSKWNMNTPKLDNFRNRCELELANMNSGNHLY